MSCNYKNKLYFVCHIDFLCLMQRNANNIMFFYGARMELVYFHASIHSCFRKKAIMISLFCHWINIIYINQLLVLICRPLTWCSPSSNSAPIDPHGFLKINVFWAVAMLLGEYFPAFWRIIVPLSWGSSSPKRTGMCQSVNKIANLWQKLALKLTAFPS